MILSNPAHQYTQLDRAHYGYELILMDMQRPVMDGLEATRRITDAAGPNQQAPIIALTANARQADKDACRAAGMNEVLTRPLNRDHLAECVNPWTTGSRTNNARSTHFAPSRGEPA